MYTSLLEPESFTNVNLKQFCIIYLEAGYDSLKVSQIQP